MKHRALIIEDDPEVLSAIEEVLDSIGHRCDVVSNLADALKHCVTGQYAYVLSDMEIHARPGRGKPRVQNIENLLERLAEMSNGECLPIILMTDFTAPENPLLVKMMRLAANLRERGVCEFIGKPFPSEGRTLDRVIKKVLGPYVAPQPRGRGRGKKSIMVASAAEDSDLAKRPARKGEGAHDVGKWLTVTDAARLLMHDVPSLDLAKARSRISTAAGRKEFNFAGAREDRRIEPHSFDSWRIKQRDRDLDQEDEEDDVR